MHIPVTIINPVLMGVIAIKVFLCKTLYSNFICCLSLHRGGGGGIVYSVKSY